MQTKIMLTLLFIRNKKLLSEFILPAIALFVLFLFYLKDYFIFSTSSIFGILLLPYVIHIRKPEKKSIRFLFIMLFFILLAYLSPLNTLVYLAWISALLLLIENSFGKISLLGFIYLISISPIFNYFGNFFGVPVRLELTTLAGNILNSINFKNQVAGNLITTPNNEFSVDPACMGLNMLTISFMLAIVIAVHYEKQSQKKLNLFFTGCFLIIVFLFNVVGNLFRIILLVLFHIPAENSMHDILGIICLIVYVLIPLWYTTRFFYTKLSSFQKNEQPAELKKNTTLLNITAIVLLAITGHFIKIKIKDVSFLPAQCSIDGYKKSLATKDVIQFEDTNTLIYVKPVNSFYGAEHTPMICWVGSGYSFKQVKKIVLHNKEIFIGKLTKGKDVIYCSWWFDNGTHKTINQLEWRWNVLSGSKPYSLINVNTTDEKKLYSKTEDIISKNIFIKK
jgi:exosortase N